MQAVVDADGNLLDLGDAWSVRKAEGSRTLPVREVRPPLPPGMRFSITAFTTTVTPNEVILTYTPVPLNEADVSPFISHDVVEANEHFIVRYLVHHDGATYSRPALNKWWRRSAKPPQECGDDNPFLLQYLDGGVPITPLSHISVCISGQAEYECNLDAGAVARFVRATNTHNVSNGSGWMPTGPFKRTFSGGYTSACLLFKPNVDPAIQYGVEVLQIASGEGVRFSNWDFAFVCKGQVEGISDAPLPIDLFMTAQQDSIVLLGKRDAQ